MPVRIEASPAELRRARDLLRRRDELLIARGAAAVQHRDFVPLPHQVPPLGEPGIDWFLWLLTGGRGSGKTEACAYYMNKHAMGPPCLAGPVPHRMAILGPTLGDVSEACVNGPSGLRAHNPAVVEKTQKGGTFVFWPNGALAKEFGAYTPEDAERLRAGGNRCMAWLEEVAAWRYLKTCWEHVDIGLLRLGPHPHAVASTTPRNRPTYRKMKALAASTNSLSHATTAQNPHLPQQRREKLYANYGGTRLGLRELEGQDLEDVEGALWTDELIEACRVTVLDAGELERQRLVIAVDPSWGTTNDEVGIVAGFSCMVPQGKGRPDVQHAYILEDLSGTMTPSEWGAKAFEAYQRLSADKVIGEGNFQGEQVRLVQKVAQAETGLLVNFGLVYASRGKVLRAEPVVALYEQRRVHHVGRLVGLEHQMTTWVPPRNATGAGVDAGDPDEPERDADQETGEEALPSSYSPDRVDALVFLVTELLLGAGGPGRIGVPQGQVPGVRRGGAIPSARSGSPRSRSRGR